MDDLILDTFKRQLVTQGSFSYYLHLSWREVRSCVLLPCIRFWYSDLHGVSCRYSLMEQTCWKNGIFNLLTGHHADDQVCSRCLCAFSFAGSVEWCYLLWMLPWEEFWLISSSFVKDPLHIRQFFQRDPVPASWHYYYVGNLHQTELFMMRLARSSGIIGLAGMAFVSHFYSRRPTSTNQTGLLLVRPLLQFSKQDLYAVCPIILPVFAETISYALTPNMIYAFWISESGVENIFNGSNLIFLWLPVFSWDVFLQMRKRTAFQRTQSCCSHRWSVFFFWGGGNVHWDFPWYTWEVLLPWQLWSGM